MTLPKVEQEKRNRAFAIFRKALSVFVMLNEELVIVVLGILFFNWTAWCSLDLYIRYGVIGMIQNMGG